MGLLSWATSQGSLLQFCVSATSRCLAVVLLIVASFYGSWLWSLLTSTLAQKIKPGKKGYQQALDDAIIRRFVRDEFFQKNKNFDHNCNSSVSVVTQATLQGCENLEDCLNELLGLKF